MDIVTSIAKDAKLLVHDIKCWPEFFKYLWSGEKTFELRNDDRGYAAGDTLIQREWTKKNGYTGRWIKFDVPFVLSGTWLAPNHVCMSLKELERYEPRGLSAVEGSTKPEDVKVKSE